jgi:hypothetical protein
MKTKTYIFKSAIDNNGNHNNGNFDESSDDIRLQLIGEQGGQASAQYIFKRPQDYECYDMHKWLVDRVKRKYKSAVKVNNDKTDFTLSSKETDELVVDFAKKYKLSISDAIRQIKGLGYDGFGSLNYDTNFGQNNISGKAKLIVPKHRLVQESRTGVIGESPHISDNNVTPITREEAEALVSLLKKSGLAKNVIFGQEALAKVIEEDRKKKEVQFQFFSKEEKSNRIALLRNTEYIETGETRIDKDYNPDNPEYKVYVPVFINEWWYADNTNPETEEFDTLDEALDDLSVKGDYDYVNDYFTPIKLSRLYIKEVWIDANGEIVEEGRTEHYSDWAYDNKENTFVKEFGNDNEIDSKNFSATNDFYNEVVYDKYLISDKIIDMNGNTFRVLRSDIGKYSNIHILEDKSGNEVGNIKLRVADHTYNPARNEDGDNFISVEISNREQGRYRPGKHQLSFGNEDTVEDVRKALLERIEEIVSDWDIDIVRSLCTPAGEVYGAVKAGVVYLDDTRLNANTPIHEFGHLWCDLVEHNNSNLWTKIKELVRETPYFKNLLDNPTYAHLTDDNARCNEAFSQAIGDEGQRVFHNLMFGENFKERFRQLLREFWRWTGAKLGIRDLPPEQISKLTFKQVVKGAVADITAAVRLPIKIGKIALTNEQQQKLEKGNVVQMEGLTDKFGKKCVADIRWNFEKKKLEFRNIKEVKEVEIKEVQKSRKITRFRL